MRDVGNGLVCCGIEFRCELPFGRSAFDPEGKHPEPNTQPRSDGYLMFTKERRRGHPQSPLELELELLDVDDVLSLPDELPLFFSPESPLPDELRWLLFPV